MARIKLSAILSSINGKLGGSIFQNSRSGLILKNNNYLPKKNTFLKNSVQSKMKFVKSTWSFLTEEQKSVWKSFANFSEISQKHNKKLKISAYELFVKINNYRLLYNYDLMIVPEFSKCDFLPFTAEFSLISNELIMQTNRTFDINTEFIILKITPLLKTSVKSASSRLRLMIFNTNSSGYYNLNTQYVNQFHKQPVSGSNLIVSYTNMNLLTGSMFQFSTYNITL